MVRFRSYQNVDVLDDKLRLESFSKRLADSRAQFEIAVVDDQPFTPVESLRRHHYNITHFPDLTSIDALQRYGIVLCDLTGVGMHMSPTLQGAHIIVEAKKNYPEKVIVAYTGGGDPILLQTSIAAADHFLKKDASVEEWVEVLDESINELANPAKVWRKTRHRLLDIGLSPYQLAEIEDLFVRKTMRGESFSLDDLKAEGVRLNLPSPAKAILEHVIIHIGFELAKTFIRGAGG